MSRLLAILVLCGHFCAVGVPAQELVTGWVHAAIDPSSGSAGLEVLPGDTGDRLVIASYLDASWYWQIVAPAGGPWPWRTEAFFHQPWEDVAAVRVGDLDDDAAPEIVVANRQEGRIEVRDGATLAIEAEFVALPGLRAVGIADLDGTPPDEIIVGRSGEARAYTANGTQLGAAAGTLQSNPALAVGQFDGDSAIELVTPGGQVLEGAGLVPDGSDPDLGGNWLVSADLDRDGRSELVRSKANLLESLDVETGVTRWSLPLHSDHWNRFLIADAEGEGRPSLFYGPEVSYGGFVVRDGEDLWAKWTLPSSPEVESLALMRHVILGRPVLWRGTGAYSSGPDYFEMLDAETGESIHRSTSHRSYVGPVLGDFDGDGVLDLVVVERTDWAPAQLLMFDPVGGDLRRVEPLGVWNGSPWAVAADDLDGDGVHDLVVAGTSTTYRAGLIALALGKGSGIEVLWEWKGSPPDGVRFSALTTADLDGDGERELVVGTEVVTSAGRGGIYILNAGDGSVLQVLPSTTQVRQVLGVQLDEDTGLELLYVGAGGPVFRFDATPNDALPVLFLNGPNRALGAELGQIWIGDQSGRIRRVDVDGDTVIFGDPFLVSDRPIDAIRPVDDAVWVASFGEVLRVEDGTVAARSQSFGRSIAELVADDTGQTVWGAGVIAVAKVVNPPATTATDVRPAKESTRRIGRKAAESPKAPTR
jgi:hypothetical protein